MKLSGTSQPSEKPEAAETFASEQGKVRTLTLGCKVNQYETEYIREGLLGLGWADAVQDEPADLCIVNTCTVTGEGDAKSRRAIRRLAKLNPASKIVVMGCYATRAPEEVSVLPNVTQVLTDKRELPDLLGRFGVTDIPTGVQGLSRRHRAYVKVQDGCMLRCSFCIIPHVRPKLTSRPLADIVEEVGRLVENGYREVVLTGIHLGHYGVDWNRNLPKKEWTRLSHLVERLSALPGDFRIRLSSIEATEVTRDLIRVMAEHSDKVCPHLHISMQSGSDSVLRRMRRRWGAKRFIDRCNMLKEALDTPAITTDILVGFPGETDVEFNETLSTAREVGFSKIHIFPFSARRGTPAATMKEQIAPPLKKARGRELAALEVELRDAYFRSLLGRRMQVLLEGKRTKEKDASSGSLDFLVGTSARYASVALEISSDNAEKSDDDSSRIQLGHFKTLKAERIEQGKIWTERISP